MKDANLLLEKVRVWSQKRRSLETHLENNNVSGFDAYLEYSRLWNEACRDLFGTEWYEMSSVDDQEGQILERLEAMLRKFLADEAKE